MKKIFILLIVTLMSLYVPSAYANSASRGAFWGGITGAAIGGAYGGPAGAAFGGIGGAALGGAIGSSRDRQRYEYVDQYGRPVQVRRVYRRPVPARHVVTRQVITQPTPKTTAKPKEEVIYIN